MLTSSDHILAQGVKFWTSVVEDYQIEELEQCYQIITALGEFLRTNLVQSKDNDQPLSEKEIKTDLYDLFNVIEMSDDSLGEMSTGADENPEKNEVKTKEKEGEEPDDRCL